MTTEQDAFEKIDTARRAFAQQLWSQIPLNGDPIGNRRLRKLTRTMTNDGYWEVRDAMVAAGLIEVGGGKGGSVKRCEVHQVASASDCGVRTAGLEVSLYSDIERRLFELSRDEARFDDFIVDITGLQGRRSTGGRWSRPDLTLVGVKAFSVMAGAYVEVQTYEVKTGSAFDVTALHEARAHRRCAHRSYVLVDIEREEDEERVADQIDVARDLGVGLISFASVDDDWNTWYDPDLVLPDPIDLDRFLDTQLGDESKDKIRQWHAIPAPGGSD